MTTTGDLFVNIKGNNQGLKRSLNQSSRDISTFGKQTERSMKGGLGAMDILGIGAVSNAQTLIKGVQAMNTRRRQNKHSVHELMRTFSADGRPNRQFIGPLPRTEHLRHRNNQQFIDATRARRKRVNAEQKAVSPMMRSMLASPGVLAAVAGVTAAVLATNGKKFADRINGATNQYSGMVAANRARLHAENVRRDIRLARDPRNQAFSMFRQNAADFRKNAGSAQLGNAYNAGAGILDYILGAVSGGLANSLTGNLLMSNRMVNAQGGVI